jgi:hypothetical protein
MIAAAETVRCDAAPIAPAVSSIDWAAITVELHAQGAAVLPGLLVPAACHALAVAVPARRRSAAASQWRPSTLIGWNGLQRTGRNRQAV